MRWIRKKLDRMFRWLFRTVVCPLIGHDEIVLNQYRVDRPHQYWCVNCRRRQ